MRIALLVAALFFCAVVVAQTGCTYGLTEDQAAAVNDFQAQRKAKQAEYKAIQEKLVALARQIAAEDPESPAWKKLWDERDELLASGVKVKAEIDEIVKSIKALEAKGVPGWSIALNVVEWLVVGLFGGGGLLSGVVSGIKSAKARKLVQATVQGIEDAGQTKTKKAVQTRAEGLGVETALNGIVTTFGG